MNGVNCAVQELFQPRSRSNSRICISFERRRNWDATNGSKFRKIRTKTNRISNGLEKLGIFVLIREMTLLRSRDIFKKVGMFRKHGFRSSRIVYDLFLCLIKYPLYLVCTLFWKTKIVIRSRPTVVSKNHIFQMFPWWLFERSRGQRNSRPESCDKSHGVKV
jgi:hypothetical protein